MSALEVRIPQTVRSPLQNSFPSSHRLPAEQQVSQPVDILSRRRRMAREPPILSADSPVSRASTPLIVLSRAPRLVPWERCGREVAPLTGCTHTGCPALECATRLTTGFYSCLLLWREGRGQKTITQMDFFHCQPLMLASIGCHRVFKTCFFI